MHKLIAIMIIAAAMALPGAALAATRAPEPATVTIVIPAFPAASVAHAMKKALGHMPNIKILKRHAGNGADNPMSAPPGVLKFAAGEINRTMIAQVGKIVSIYPVTIPKGRKGHLIVIKIKNTSPTQSVVQPDSNNFTLHTGERAILVRSTMNGWARVLPYNGPDLSGNH